MKKSILITTMALGIGGAETHIVELTKKLVSFGYRVTVASNGGIYEKDLAKYGAKHIKVPMHTKNPFSLMKSYRLLKKIIVRENIDLVHAHARIPAFLCNFVCRKYNVPFVTTVHYEFRTSFLFKKFTRWGSYTLSVSEDINAYLINNYKYDRHRAALTVNGIDDTVFYPRDKKKKIMDEFNLTQKDNVIATICRIDKGSSKTAFMLTEIAESLSREIKNLRIVIVGDGSLFEKLKDKAADVNKRNKREIITVAGARRDISEILSVVDVFTGVSRAALEAMAMEKPVVLCGDLGYLGIMDSRSREMAIETNMTCRETAEADNTKLHTDLVLMFSNENIRKENARLNIKTVKDYYSVDKMADDAVSMYKKAINEKEAPPRYYHAVLSGYYGFDNSGDEAMLASILREMRAEKQDIRIMVLSKKPGETMSKYDVDSMGRANPFTIYKIFGKTGMLISGGGNLIQDLTSFKSMIYYTSLMNYAKFRGLKVMLYANGIGPLIRKSSEKIASRVLNKTDLITVREPNSFEMLKNIGVVKPRMAVTADPVTSFDMPDSDTIKESLKKHMIPKDGKTAVFSVRPWKGLEGAFKPIFAQIADYVSKKYDFTPVFVPLNTKKDTRICEEIVSLMKCKAVLVEDENSVASLVGIISQAELLIGMRLHSLIYAAITGTPVIGIVYDPKVRYFIELMQQEDGGLIENLKFDKIVKMIDRTIMQRDEYVETLKKNMIRLGKLSAENARLAIELMYEERQ